MSNASLKSSPFKSDVDANIGSVVHDIDNGIYMQMMDTMHPLRKKNITEIFPILSYLNFEDDHTHNEEKETKTSKFNMKVFKKFNNNTRKFMKRLQNSDDPIKELGPGISTFHSLMMLLFLLFVILGCIHIPVL